MNTMLRRLAVIGASTTMTAVALAAPASADTQTITFDGPTAVCKFPVVVTFTGQGSQMSKSFYDKAGNLRTISAGTGYALTFTNGADTNHTFSTAPNGAVNRSWTYADGSSIGVMTGHNAVFMYASDVGGMKARLYTGKVVISIDPRGTWTIVTNSGREIDVCAALTA